MSDKTYDVLKNTALLLVPVLAFASTLLAVWDVPYQAQLTQSLTALDAMIGTLVVVAKKIHDGEE